MAHAYKVTFSNANGTHEVSYNAVAKSAEKAKKVVWEAMKDGWTFGFQNEAEFIAHSKAKRV